MVFVMVMGAVFATLDGQTEIALFLVVQISVQVMVPVLKVAVFVMLDGQGQTVIALFLA